MKKFEEEKLENLFLEKKFTKESHKTLFYLQEIQNEFGYLSYEHMNYLAEFLDIHNSQIESIVSFYKFFNLENVKYTIRICHTISCDLKNKDRIIKGFENELGIKMGEITANREFQLSFCSCLGMCDRAPAILINDRLFSKVSPSQIPQIIEACKNNRLNEDFPETIISTVHFENRLIITTHKGISIKNALKNSPEEILQTLREVNLRGRGGAGFPTWKKWELAKISPDTTKYVVCNADEGEPGTFKDRFLLHKYFGKIIEGMIIAGYTIGAQKGIIYLRGEYLYLVPTIKKVLKEYETDKLLGNNFEIELRMGMGAYVCGEETALIESLEGKRGEPRNRPPYPIDTGYLDKPTIVNNVETFYDIALIFELGNEYFNKFGTKDSRGLKLFSVSGDLEAEGVYVIPYGTTLQELVEMTRAKNIYAIVVGGAQGEIIKKDDFNKILAFEALPSGGSIILLNKNRDLLTVLQNFLEFFVEESCGQCTPCRLGVNELLNGVIELKKGKLSLNKLNKLIELANTIKLSSKCGLGTGSVNGFLSLVENFKEDILGRIEGEKHGNS